jgi:acetolactate synthase-1/2/3 large subunit
VAILGNVKETLPAVTKLLNKNEHKEWIASFDEYDKKEFDSVINKEVYPTEGPIKMGEVVRKISDATNRKAILVTDVGQNQMAAIRYFQFTEKRSVVTSGGAGTMGFGIPAAIGAKIAAPERTVCLFCGDGGFQMTMQELGTIMQENIGIKMIIMNNNFLGMVRQWQELFYNERYSSTPLVNPDFTTIASAYGIKSRLVNEREELDGAINEMLSDDKSFLLIVNVDMKELIYPMIPAGGSVTNILIN